MERGTTPEGSLAPLTLRQRLILGFCIGFMAIQVAVPIRQLMAPRLARWGWQMYSAALPQPVFLSVSANGAETPLDLIEYVASARPDLDLPAMLPAHVCRLRPELAAVRYRYSGGGTEEYRCP
jgi:hypothetical protein